MTLLAAFTIHDIPILMGDFLLTDEQVNTNHIFYPTRPELKGVKPSPGERRICGLSKKIHIIKNNRVDKMRKMVSFEA